MEVNVTNLVLDRLHSIDIMSHFFLDFLLMRLQFIESLLAQSVSFGNLFFEVLPLLLANAFRLVFE